MELEFGSRARAANSTLLSGRKAALNIGFLSALTLGVLFSTNPLHHATQTPSFPDVMRTLRTQVEDLTPKPVAPSAYKAEAAMSQAELMVRWEPIIADAAKRFDISADWIRAVMRIESGGRIMLAENQRIVSPAGAVGLMQLLPGTYEEMRAQYGLGADAFDPHDNIYAGAAYLKWLHHRYGNPGMFAAYNAGPESSKRICIEAANCQRRPRITSSTRSASWVSPQLRLRPEQPAK